MARIRTDVNTYGFHCGTMTRVAHSETPFARALLVLLNERGWSQRRIAQAMGLSHAQVARYLDEGQDPALSRAAGLAEAAGVSLDWLAGRPIHLPKVVVDDVEYAPSGAGVDPAVAEAAKVLPAVPPDRRPSEPTRQGRRASRREQGE